MVKIWPRDLSGLPSKQRPGLSLIVDCLLFPEGCANALEKQLILAAASTVFDQQCPASALSKSTLNSSENISRWTWNPL
ncbi:hypothetical protein DL98DRAFT_512236 [Cadophora sp. DSE1049]|nr:hypothetical protein DL98DRAFT_512236 [Cadophora sp. DSE1049]